MVARIAWLALSMGILVGCYDLPQPECGFACGPAGACPSSYSCNAAVNRCVLNGTTPTCDPAFANDFIPPRVTDMVPVPSAMDVALDTAIIARFSEPVRNVSGNLRVELDGIPISGFVDYDEPLTGAASFQPSENLMPSTEYRVLVLDGITDDAGNPLAISVWQFTTAPDPLPPF